MYKPNPQTTSTTSPASTLDPVASGILLLVYAVIIVLSITVMWKVFSKAGESGWKSLIPFYNTYILLKISGMSGWWLLGMLIPFASIVVLVLAGINLAKSFGRSTTFGVIGLSLFSLVGYAILAFGKSTYVGPGGIAAGTAPLEPATSSFTPPTTAV